MGNRGNRHRYVMWIVLAVVVLLLAALIVAIALDVEVSARTSAAILAACGVIAVALVVSSSRLTAQRRNDTDQSDESTGGAGPAAGNISNWMFLADAYVAKEEFEAAERLYRRAVEAGHAPANASLSEVLYELGRDDEAEFYRRVAREAGE